MSQDKQIFRERLEKDLVADYGHVVANHDLCKLLGFKNMAALNANILRRQEPVAIFSLENRRGKFALTKDIAALLTDKRFEALEKTEGGHDE